MLSNIFPKINATRYEIERSINSEQVKYECHSIRVYRGYKPGATYIFHTLLRSAGIEKHMKVTDNCYRHQHSSRAIRGTPRNDIEL